MSWLNYELICLAFFGKKSEGIPVNEKTTTGVGGKNGKKNEKTTNGVGGETEKMKKRQMESVVKLKNEKTTNGVVTNYSSYNKREQADF